MTQDTDVGVFVVGMDVVVEVDELPLPVVDTVQRRRNIPPPTFVWPADHRWCYSSDVDPRWAGIGASAAAIEPLTRRSDVDVVRA